MGHYLDFEKPLEQLELRLEELKRLGEPASQEVRELEGKISQLSEDIFSNLTRWQKTQIARHPNRPYSLDYIELVAEDFVELHGDRNFMDDPAVVGGLGALDGRSVMFIGHQKGRGVKGKIKRNFGQPHPEGYRKALRLMRLAEQFGRPVVTFIDTPGAYPGIGAEERGQAEAIATNLMEMSRLKVPIVSVVIGEGGSGGAIALGVADRMYMLEHSIYSVISPEGCATILWRKNGDLSQEDFERAADALKLTSQDLLGYGIIGGIIPEPQGGAHRNTEEMARGIRDTVSRALDELTGRPAGELVDERYARLRDFGKFIEGT